MPAYSLTCIFTRETPDVSFSSPRLNSPSATWNRNVVSFWNWQYGSVRASPPQRHENTLPSSQVAPNGDGREVSSAVGTRHAFVHATAFFREPSLATISGHASLVWHAEQSTPAHPTGHDPRSSPETRLSLPSRPSLL